jgi:phosphoenolpyruvate synthase/pyruvate phosphate dikinase
MDCSYNWDDFKVRCSGIKKIMSNGQGNAPITENQLKKMAELEDKLQAKGCLTEKQQAELAELKVKEAKSSEIVLSDTCIEYLMEVYAWETQGMIPVNKESLDMLATRKGRKAETDAVTLLCRVDKALYKVHKDRISNDFLSGEVDIYLGESIYEATNITDIKNSFDYPTFLRKMMKSFENGQEEQVQGYMDITGAKEGYIANTLVTAPIEIIEEMKWKVAKKMDAISIESPDFLAEWPKWERSMKFDHIPPAQRVWKLKAEPFSELYRQRLYDRVKYCREWLASFHEQYTRLLAA